VLSSRPLAAIRVRGQLVELGGEGGQCVVQALGSIASSSTPAICGVHHVGNPRANQLDEAADAIDVALAAEASALRSAATVAALPTGRSAGRPVG
jgi:hypothetical protein